MSSTSSISNFLSGRSISGRRGGRIVHARFIFILLSFVSMCLFDDSTRVFQASDGVKKRKKVRENT